MPSDSISLSRRTISASKVRSTASGGSGRSAARVGSEASDASSSAALGLFLGFQHPEEIPGVSVYNFLRQAIAARKGIDDYSVLEVRMQLMAWTKRLGQINDLVEQSYTAEVLTEKQLAMLAPPAPTLPSRITSNVALA